MLGKRRKKPKPIANMERIIEEFRKWEPNINNTTDDMSKLCCWIKELEENYSLLVNSKRWKAANRIISFANRIIFRNDCKVVTDKFNAIFSEFKSWQQEVNKITEINKKDYDFHKPVSADYAVGEHHTLIPPHPHR